MSSTPTIRFDRGMLVASQFANEHLKQITESLGQEATEMRYDERCLEWRMSAHIYRDIVYHFYRHRLPLEDHARGYEKLELVLQESIVPRPHQAKAMKAWTEAGCRGVVSLPTGAGKTILAVMAMAHAKRSSLVVVPTIDLLQQWRSILQRYFAMPIGAYGGGEKDLQPLTVATYDSAHLIIESHGHRFGLLVFDECHHLPASQYQLIARAAIAPFRLGLSATVERTDGGEQVLYQLVGHKVFEGAISEMVDKVLAPYEVVSIEVPLTAEERQAYESARQVYTGFLRRNRVNMTSPQGWQDFIRKSSYLPGGREAMQAYRDQKRLAQASATKIVELWAILQRHQGEKIIIFTNDNQLAYHIGRQFILPVLTHQTKPKERARMLSGFRSDELDILVTSKVLNEGVDVPEASVGVVVSGSGAVREHVQRLGRILRHREGKQAVLYELIAKNTAERFVNQRRRNHHAYQGTSQVQPT